MPSADTANSNDPSTPASTTCPAVRTTARSPSPRSKTISAATRESMHPNTTANGSCALRAVWVRRVRSWLGCSGRPATKRTLPAASSRQASAGDRSVAMRASLQASLDLSGVRVGDHLGARAVGCPVGGGHRRRGATGRSGGAAAGRSRRCRSGAGRAGSHGPATRRHLRDGRLGCCGGAAVAGGGSGARRGRCLDRARRCRAQVRRGRGDRHGRVPAAGCRRRSAPRVGHL